MADAFRSIRRMIVSLSAVVFAVGLYRIGSGFYVDGAFRFGNPLDAPLGVPSPDAAGPRRVRAEVTRMRGHQLARVSDTCEFLVEQRPLTNGQSYCNAQVICGGKLVYGGPDRGFFACKLYGAPRRDIVGSDPSTTSSDHDAALSLDTRSGVLRVWDDARGPEGAFDLEAEIIDVE